jgi:hypothetical protein
MFKPGIGSEPNRDSLGTWAVGGIRNVSADAVLMAIRTADIHHQDGAVCRQACRGAVRSSPESCRFLFAHRRAVMVTEREGATPESHVLSRRNSVTSWPLATKTMLAMPMNRPCSTTPVTSLSLRESAGASGICPKLQSRM